MATKRRQIKSDDEQGSVFVDSSSAAYKATERELVQRAEAYEEAEREYARLRREIVECSEPDAKHSTSAPPP